MIFVYIKSKTTGATYQCSCVLLNLCFFQFVLAFPRGNVLFDVDANPSDFISYKKMKNQKITLLSEHIFYNNIYTIVYIYFYYRLEILNTQQFYIAHLTLSCMTYIKIYVNKICADQSEVSDGKLNVQIMNVLEIFINHEIYEIASPWCL